MTTYQLDQIPFSYPGSFLTITALNPRGTHRLLYRTCSQRIVTRDGETQAAADFFEIALMKADKEIVYEWTAQPYRLDCNFEGTICATFVFSDPETILFETYGVNMRLIPCKSFEEIALPALQQIHLTDYTARGQHKIRVSHKSQLNLVSSDHLPEATTPYALPPLQVEITRDKGVKGAIRFSRYEGQWDEPLDDLGKALARRKLEYENWQTHLPEVLAQHREAAEQAWFILWSCQVPAEGALTRPAIYMSKFWMNAIWAWDNCFNALAVAKVDPQLAWDQLLLFFDHQDLKGMVPDMINDLEAIYGFTKPPIHGWAILKLVERVGLKSSMPYLKQLYRPVSRLTQWWYQQRDYDKDGMPQYHHGNDSGWDNATLFDQGYPTESADLAAHLVLQCEALAWMAEKLGKTKAAARWQNRAKKQLEALLTLGVKDNHFFSPLNGKQDAPESQSLLNYIPIELGKRLPEPIFTSLVNDLSPSGPFLTDYGLATESPASPKYEPDGYWRGPIWAPSTYLIFDGLVKAGKKELATIIAERFCDMCVKNPGFWENYDALTGKGLRCPAYSWTASVFLLMAEWLKG